VCQPEINEYDDDDEYTVTACSDYSPMSRSDNDLQNATVSLSAISAVVLCDTTCQHCN